MKNCVIRVVSRDGREKLGERLGDIGDHVLASYLLFAAIQGGQYRMLHGGDLQGATPLCPLVAEPDSRPWRPSRNRTLDPTKPFGYLAMESRKLRSKMLQIGCAIILLSTPATVANASQKLWLKQARAVTAKFVSIDLRAGGAYYPDHISATTPSCGRVSQRRAACTYTLTYKAFTQRAFGRHYFAAVCPHKVRVRLNRSGKPIGRPVYTSCYPKSPEDDYEV